LYTCDAPGESKVSALTQRPDLAHLRPYTRSDRFAAFELLKTLPQLYPDGYDWLHRRLIDVEEGKAGCHMATVDGALAGILIETPKGARSLKLSTLWVAAPLRHRGIARRLLKDARSRWLMRELDQVTVTVACGCSPEAVPAFASVGFRPVILAKERYGPNRDELIMAWRPD
jgi:GNAT superfamily N-acetyltransferase